MKGFFYLPYLSYFTILLLRRQKSEVQKSEEKEEASRPGLLLGQLVGLGYLAPVPP